MRIILHAGMHKTGTTSFQDWLTAAAGELAAAAGVQAHAAPKQINARNPSRYDPQWLTRQIEDAESRGLDAVLFSNEVLSVLDEPQWGLLREVFGDRPIRLVVAFRHWVGFLPSRWAQNCRRRDAQSFPRFLERLEQDPMRPDARFDVVLSRARSVGIEDIVALSFDNAVRGDGIVPELRDACGLPDVGTGLGARPSNPSPPMEEIERTRLFHGVLADSRGENPDGLFDGVTGSATEHYDLAGRVRAVADADPGLTAALDALVHEKTRDIELTPERFASWAEALEAAAAPYLRNPVDGRLFGDVHTKTVRASGFEYGELPQEMRARMLRWITAAGVPWWRRTVGRVRRMLAGRS